MEPTKKCGQKKPNSNSSSSPKIPKNFQLKQKRTNQRQQYRFGKWEHTDDSQLLLFTDKPGFVFWERKIHFRFASSAIFFLEEFETLSKSTKIFKPMNENLFFLEILAILEQR